MNVKLLVLQIWFIFQCSVALFDMIEYYDSACQLNISFNKNIGVRGWQACARLIRRVRHILNKCNLVLADVRSSIQI